MSIPKNKELSMSLDALITARSLGFALVLRASHPTGWEVLVVEEDQDGNPLTGADDLVPEPVLDAESNLQPGQPFADPADALAAALSVVKRRLRERQVPIESDGIAKRMGFKDAAGLKGAIDQVRVDSPEDLAALKGWAREDGSKVGLNALPKEP
jgi:hypothetical protein